MKQVFFSMLVVLASVSAIELVLQLIMSLSFIGKGGMTWWVAMKCSVLRLTYSVYQLFPVIGFLGGLIGLGRLSSSNELVAMRAAGFSKWQLLKCVLVVSSLMMCGVTFLGEVFGTKWLSAAYSLQSRALHAKVSSRAESAGRAPSTLNQPGLNPAWLYQRGQFIHITHVASAHLIQGVYFFEFNRRNELNNVMYAQSAEKKQGRGWYLRKRMNWHFGPQNIYFKRLSDAYYPLSFNSVQQQKLHQKNSDQILSVRALYQLIHYLDSVGLDSSLYQYALWFRVLQPFSTILMMCLGLPFVYGSLRVVSIGQRVLMGILVGFVFYMLNSFSGEIGMIMHLSPGVSALIPLFIFGVLYVYFNKRAEG